MSVVASLRTEGDDARGALCRFFRALLNAGQVDALLLPCRVGDGTAIMPTLVDDIEMLGRCEPLAPVMSMNTAALVSHLTGPNVDQRLGVLLRPCELRAVIELAKLRQVDLHNVLTIGIDCLGTYELTDYVEMWEAGRRPDAIWQSAGKGIPTLADDYQLRSACRICTHPAPAGADISIGLIGVGDPRELLIETREDLLLPVKLSDPHPTRRREVLERLVAERYAVREAALSAWRERVSDMQALLNEFATCIRCHNCMVACPICYCKECVFRTPTFDHEASQYFQWAQRKGALRMPTDTLLFHLTRLNHMATSCVGCGMCDTACPSNLPVATMFQAVAERVQALFDYEAGRSLDEEVPLATFREDELTNMGH